MEKGTAEHAEPRAAWRGAALAGLCLALCGVLLHAGLPLGARLGVAVGWAALASVVRAPGLGGWALVALALGMRGLVLTGDAGLSDDLYRYLWEGRVLLGGGNPFTHAPDDPALAPLRDGLWARVQHKEVSAIYPPGAMALFAATRALGGEVGAWRALAGLADVGTVGALAWVARGRGLPNTAALVWALHPLPALESAGSGHLEALALPGLVVALGCLDRGRVGWAAAVASAGALVKLLPLVVLGPTLRRPSRALGLGLGAGAALGLGLLAPLWDAGALLGRGFGRYYEAWAFNASLFHLLEALTGDGASARRLGVALGALWVGWAWAMRRDPAAFALHACGALVLLSPVVHPWYVLWALAPALLLGVWPWLVLAAGSLLSYTALETLDAAGRWQEPTWVIGLEYPPFFLSLGWWVIQRWRSRA